MYTAVAISLPAPALSTPIAKIVFDDFSVFKGAYNTRHDCEIAPLCRCLMYTAVAISLPAPALSAPIAGLFK
jgi:hypothetical protein